MFSFKCDNNLFQNYWPESRDFSATKFENIKINSFQRQKKANKLLLGLFIWYLTAGIDLSNLRFGISHSEELHMATVKSTGEERQNHFF